jgi:uncharacterized protein (TIGR03032 family)
MIVSEQFTVPPQTDGPPLISVPYEFSANFAELLAGLNISLVVSNFYRGGQLVVLGTHNGRLSCTFHTFEHPLGIAVRPDRIAVCTRRQIDFLRAAPGLAEQLSPQGLYDGCYLSRHSHLTGEVQAHEIAWSDDNLWVTNTLFSCLCTLDDHYSFVPRWKPSFVSELAPEDRCHLNGLAMFEGEPRYVTALGETNTFHGWRSNKNRGGCLIDVRTKAVITRGLAMPHTPRLYGGRLWVLESGQGRLLTVEPESGRTETVVTLPGYTRGMSLIGPYAFVGLSIMRKTTQFGETPIADLAQQLRCGIRVVDLRSGHVVARFDFISGVEEIFGVEIVPKTRLVALSSPNPQIDGRQNIWYIPPVGKL